MPELPEVETVVRDLQPLLINRKFSSVEVTGEGLRHPWRPEWEDRLVGTRIFSINRTGKWIWIHLVGGPLAVQFLVLHLGMTGQLTIANAREPLATHTHMVFGLGRGRQLRFRDIRRFGSAQLHDYQSFFDFHAKLGVDALRMEKKYFREQLGRSQRSLKAILLDQQVLAGVGNIYADEALFQAQLHPARIGTDVSSTEADRLTRAIVTVLKRAIKKRGSSIRNYVGGNGLKGGYQQEFRVYGRTGEPCRRCKTPIERIRLAGRSTHYCPHCQSKVQSPKSKVEKPD